MQPAQPTPPQNEAHSDGPEQWLRECWVAGVTAGWVTKISQVGRSAVMAYADMDADIAAGTRAFAAMAAMGRGDYDLADALFATPLGPVSPSVRLLDAAARLYRACGDAEQDPQRAMNAMQTLNEARRQVGADKSLEAATARGYAGLSLGEAFLMIGDVGAGRLQLEGVIDEDAAPAALLTTVRAILGGIELAVGRADLSAGHLQAAVREAAGLPAEEQTAKLLLCGVMLGGNRRYGLALLEEFSTRFKGKAPGGQGTVARLYRLLQLLAGSAPFLLPVRAEVRDILRFLQGRHYSAGWFLLLTGVTAAALRSAGDPCECYGVLIHAAATLRCRRMDGAADLCDRQIEALRGELGEDRFEALLGEAQHRRQLFLSYQDQRDEIRPTQDIRQARQSRQSG